MKRLYTYYPEFNDKDEVLWLVEEESTSQIIDEFWFEEDAAKYCSFLERGGAFAGFTPSFVIKKTYSGDINAYFDMEFSE